MKQRIEAKRQKVSQLEQQRKNYELQIASLELATQGHSAKLQKRAEQLKTSEALIRK